MVLGSRELSGERKIMSQGLIPPSLGGFQLTKRNRNKEVVPGPQMITFRVQSPRKKGKKCHVKMVKPEKE